MYQLTNPYRAKFDNNSSIYLPFVCNIKILWSCRTILLSFSLLISGILFPNKENKTCFLLSSLYFNIGFKNTSTILYMRIAKLSVIPVFIGIIFLYACNRQIVSLDYTNAKDEVPQLSNLTFRFSKPLVN